MTTHKSWRYERQGIVTRLEAGDKDEEDLAYALIFFDGPNEDSVRVEIPVPSGTLKLRDALLVTVELLMTSQHGVD